MTTDPNATAPSETTIPPAYDPTRISTQTPPPFNTNVNTPPPFNMNNNTPPPYYYEAPSEPVIDNAGMFKRPFSFKGRIRRLEYGISMLILIPFHFLIRFILSTPNLDGGLLGLILLLYIPFCWFSMAQSTKRCHDLDHSGWYQFIPLYGILLLFEDGEADTNGYGTPPKYEY